MHFVDREAKYPNRWTMTKANGSSEVVTLIRNDEPIVEGTPMNAETLNTLSDVAGADVAKEEAIRQANAAAASASDAAKSQQDAFDSATAASKSQSGAETAQEKAEAAAALAGTRASTDKTLTIADAPADAKAVGDRIDAIKIETDTTLKIPGAAADAATVGNIVLPRLVVKIEYGSSVTITDGMGAEITGTSTSSGTFSTTLPHDGEWAVSATLNTGVATGTVQTAYCQTETLELSYYKLIVSVDAGSRVTVQNGSQTLTKTVPSSGSATVIFYLPNIGTWRVTAILGSESTESSITVDSGHHTYSVQLAYVRIYGASWDGTSTTRWSRTDKAAEFTDPVPYVAGVSSYGSPFDNLQPWAGMVKSERTGGTMVAIPKFWYKLTQNGRGMTIQIADRAVEGYSVSPAHMDREDGHGERDVVYVGRYHCNSRYKSGTGVLPKVSITCSTARSGIHKLGSTIWQSDFAMRFTIWLLYIVEFCNWNSQEAIGYGCGNNSGTQSMGYTDSMPYHTGTTNSSRTTYGCGTQYRNIEGLWDNVYDWCDGCYYNNYGLNIILNPSEFSDSLGGTVVGVPSNGYPSAFTVKTTGGYPLFIPTAANGSIETYSCDAWNFSLLYPCLYVGGNYSQISSHGLFDVDSNSASVAGAYIGCRLQQLPND